MKIKKIEQGMVVHCNTEEEAKELIKWAYECGFTWLMSSNSSIHWDTNQGHGIYYYFGISSKWLITYGDKNETNEKSIEFSDLIILEPQFNVGDYVETTDGDIGYISSICNCEYCKKEGFIN